jgi:hypothetical protein
MYFYRTASFQRTSWPSSLVYGLYLWFVERDFQAENFDGGAAGHFPPFFFGETFDFAGTVSVFLAIVDCLPPFARVFDFRGGLVRVILPSALPQKNSSQTKGQEGSGGWGDSGEGRGSTILNMTLSGPISSIEYFKAFVEKCPLVVI